MGGIMRPMSATEPQRIFIPLDAADSRSLLPTDRLVAYQPGYRLISQCDQDSLRAVVTAPASGSADPQAERPGRPPSRR